MQIQMSTYVVYVGMMCTSFLSCPSLFDLSLVTQKMTTMHICHVNDIFY